jgi:hypothetical protein
VILRKRRMLSAVYRPFVSLRPPLLCWNKKPDQFE